MTQARKHKLLDIEWPDFGEATSPAQADATEFAARIDATRAAMELWNLTHLVVYGDREHFANLAYLTGFDPRFEEALLIISSRRKPLLVVGNECEGYLNISPLYVAGELRYERFQPFSLLNQPRDQSRLIREIFADEGITQGATVGCAGWKYFADTEHPDSAHALELPAYLIDTLRVLAGHDQVTNATSIFMHPDHGLRSFCSATEIAYFEYTSSLASNGMRQMIFGLREGMLDYELAQLAGYNGTPFNCHMTLAVGENSTRALTGPTGLRIRRGDPLSTNLAYWGSNSCRAGWVAATAQDLPGAAQDYLDNFVGPYFVAMSNWFQQLRIGQPGGTLAHLINEQLPFEKFGIFLNAGHLIHLDEWVSSPIYPDSTVPLHSGMAIQVDVIPASPIYFSTRMEDGLVLADATLRAQLQAEFPACFARCQQRRQFMQNVLGIEIAEEVLPLSNIPAIIPPYLLRPNSILAMEA